MRLVLVLTFVAPLVAGCAGKPCDGVGEMCRLAGTGDREDGPDGQAALDTPLYWVSSVKQGPDGRVYVMDENNYRLRVITSEGTLETVAGIGVHGGAIEGAPANQSPFLDPIDFAFRADGANVIVSWHDPRLVEIGLDGVIHVVAGYGTDEIVGTTLGCSGTGDGGLALAAGFCELAAIAIDSKGRIFLADDMAHQIRMIDTDGTISTLAGDGNAGFDGDGGPAAAAHLDTPSALAVDHDDNLLIADSNNHVIRRIDMGTRTIATIVGSHTRGFSGDGGPCRAAQLDLPAGVTVAADGTLYVSDTYNNRIRHVDLEGDVINTIAGDGTVGLAGDNGPALGAQLKNPSRLSIADGKLYIADTLNNVARAVRLQ